MAALNRANVDYINFGGYPDAVSIQEVRDHEPAVSSLAEVSSTQVLLRDLPSLYGISVIRSCIVCSRPLPATVDMKSAWSFWRSSPAW